MVSKHSFTSCRRNASQTSRSNVDFLPRLCNLTVAESRHSQTPHRIMTGHTKPHLLKIPLELRNRIYESTVISNKRIDISAPWNKEQPGLLRTCRQVRNEALGIYYNDNNFSFTVHGYRGMEAIPAYELAKKQQSHAKRGRFIIELCENCRMVDMRNLNQWLKAYHADSSILALRQDKRSEESDARTLARRTFGVVQAMRKVPWRHVEELLAAFYRAIDTFQDEDAEDGSKEDDELSDEGGDEETDDDGAETE